LEAPGLDGRDGCKHEFDEQMRTSPDLRCCRHRSLRECALGRSHEGWSLPNDVYKLTQKCETGATGKGGTSERFHAPEMMHLYMNRNMIAGIASQLQCVDYSVSMHRFVARQHNNRKHQYISLCLPVLLRTTLRNLDHMQLKRLLHVCSFSSERLLCLVRVCQTLPPPGRQHWYGMLSVGDGPPPLP
jgi:hypothetical protein